MPHPEDLAEALDVKRSWVMAHLHELPHQKIGRQVRFTHAQIAEIVARYEVRPTPDPDDVPGLAPRSKSHARRSA